MNGETIFKLIIDLIVGLSNYAWPLVVLLCVAMFRKPLRGLIENIRELELFGNKGKFTPAVDAFGESVKKLESGVDEPESKQYVLEVEPGNNYALIPGEVHLQEKDKDLLSQQTKQTEIDINQILDDSKGSTELALLRVSALIENEAKAILGSMGFLPSGKIRLSGFAALREMERLGLIPDNTSQSLNQFFELRNSIVHGRKVAESKEILRVIDIAIELLKTIRKISHEIHTVIDTIDICDDERCLIKRDNEKAVMIKSVTVDGGLYIRIFHTSRMNYYKPGERVTWEWNLERSFEKGWYKDKKTGEIRPVGGSLDFIGRRMDDI